MWEDTVMDKDKVENELKKHCYPRPKYWDEIDLVRKAQAELSFKLGQKEVVEWIDGQVQFPWKSHTSFETWQGKLKEGGL